MKQAKPEAWTSHAPGCSLPPVGHLHGRLVGTFWWSVAPHFHPSGSQTTPTQVAYEGERAKRTSPSRL